MRRHERPQEMRLTGVPSETSALAYFQEIMYHSAMFGDVALYLWQNNWLYEVNNDDIFEDR